MTITAVQQRLHVEPVPFDAACWFISVWHRHHRPPQGHIFSLGVFLPDWTLTGVATVGRPIARHFDDGRTLEVTRVATDGAPNACSALYGAARREARRRGFPHLITYTQAGEPGSSLRGAGWRLVAERKPRKGWNAPSRPRPSTGIENTRRFLWKAPA